MGGYKHLFRISNTKKYKAGTSFEEIVSLYKFDAELRELFFKYLLQIERQMRSLMSYYFTEMYGAEQKQNLDANNYNKLDIENPIIRINTAFKGCSSLEKISVLPRIYHN